MKSIYYQLLFLCLILSACNQTKTEDTGQSEVVLEAPDPPEKKLIIDYDTLQWTDLSIINPTLKFDIKYASEDNFVQAIMYDCGRAFLRPEAARALNRARDLLPEGYNFLIYDAYRPRPFQQRLWDKVPDENYVSPPWKGSMHTRGLAVDLTIVDEMGTVLDMGTPFDYFGEEAHTDYKYHDKEILQNRQKLQEVLAEVGFRGIRTEWWHFSYRDKTYPLSDWVWNCN